MPIPTPPELPTEPAQWQQYLLGIGVVLGGAFMTVRNWKKGLSSTSEPARQMVIESGQFADMAPFREAAASLKEILIELKKLSATGGALREIETELSQLARMLRERIEHEKDEAEIERRAEEKAEAKAQAMFNRMIAGQKPDRSGRIRAPRANKV